MDESTTKHWLEIIFESPYVWGIAALIALAFGFSPRESGVGVWIALSVALITTAAFLWFHPWIRTKARRLLFTGVGILAIGASLFPLGLWLTRPKDAADPKPPTIVEHPSDNKPPDGVTAVRTEPKDPSNKKIRQAIGEFIQRGSKIRNKAPVWIGSPSTPEDRKIFQEAHLWAVDVEQFLRGNFDEAEVQRFKSLDDDSQQSLNGKLHNEIQYLMDVLGRPEMLPH